MPYTSIILSVRRKQYTLLAGSNSDTWWKAVGNELGRLATVIDTQIRSTTL